MTTDEHKKSWASILFSEGAILAAISSFVYLVTFVYEAGFCSYFGIPIFLITPNLTTVFVAASGIALLFLPAFPYLNFTAPLLRRVLNPTDRQKPFRLLYAMNTFVILSAILVIAAYGLSWKRIIWSAIAIVLLNVILFGRTFLPGKEGKTAAERFSDHQKTQDEDPFHLVDFAFESKGRKLAIATFFGFILLMIAFIFGNGNASRQKTHPVLKEHPGYVLLRSYPDVFIAASFDRRLKKIGNSIILIKGSAADTLEFTLEAVGPFDGPIYP